MYIKNVLEIEFINIDAMMPSTPIRHLVGKMPSTLHGSSSNTQKKKEEMVLMAISCIKAFRKYPNTMAARGKKMNCMT